MIRYEIEQNLYQHFMGEQNKHNAVCTYTQLIESRILEY